MGKLNYFKLMTDVNDMRLSEENFALLCKDYNQEKTISAAKIIQKKWQQSTALQIAKSLDMYGGEVYCSNLWNLYFEFKEDKFYDVEVENLLLERAYYEQQIFAKMPHSLSTDSEIKLISMRTGDIVPTIDLPVAATSYAVFSNNPSVGAGWLASIEFDQQIAIHRHNLEAMFGNLKNYLEKFALSKPALLQLIEIAQNGQRTQTPHFSYDYLCLAVRTLVRYDDFDALDKEDIQQKLLGITVWDKEKQCAVYLFKRLALGRYNMQSAPSEAMVKWLLKFQNGDFIREVLAHSWLAYGREIVLQQYPEFSAEILLSDLAHEACVFNSVEKRRSVTPEYWNLVLSKREAGCRELQLKLPQRELSVLNLCLCMYNTYTNCHFDSDNRSQILKEAIRYCETYGLRMLKAYIPQLQEAAKEEKHRIYCL